MKPLEATDDFKIGLREQFEELLRTYSPADGALSLKVDPSSLMEFVDKVRPTIYLLPEAYLKMQALIDGYSEEICWYGRVSSPTEHVYCIQDIYCYPQENTAVRTTMLEDEYIQWYLQQPDDVINNIRMQGHSHVNMTSSPSAQDYTNWTEILNTMPREYCIFTIGNKRREYSWYIYDVIHNVIYEPKDIDVHIVLSEDFEPLSAWADTEIKEHVKKIPVASAAATTNVSLYRDYDKDDSLYDTPNFGTNTVRDWEDTYADTELNFSAQYRKGYQWSYYYNQYIKPMDEYMRDKDATAAEGKRKAGRKPKGEVPRK